MCTYREAPVDLGHSGVDVEAEDQEENSRHHEGTAADKLKEVDASTGGAHHYGFYADEADEWQDLKWEEKQQERQELDKTYSIYSKGCEHPNSQTKWNTEKRTTKQKKTEKKTKSSMRLNMRNLTQKQMCCGTMW